MKCLLSLILLSPLLSWAQADNLMLSQLNPRALGRAQFQYAYDLSPGSEKTQGTTDWNTRTTITLLKGETDTLVSSLSYSELFVPDQLIVPADSRHQAFEVPHTLKSANVGFSWSRPIQEGRVMGVLASVGSDGDELFQSGEDSTVNITGLYHVPTSNPFHRWHFALNYSNNRAFANGVPLPGVMYSIFNPQKRLFAMLGFPMAMLSYGYTEHLDVKMSYMAPYHINLEHGYTWRKSLRSYARFEVQHRPFLRSNREERFAQLYYEQLRLSIGTSVPVTKELATDITVGSSFGRKFYERQSFQGSGTPARLADNWYARAQMNYRF